MSQQDRTKWDTRYATGAYRARTHPSAYLTEWLDRLPRGRALDIACGAGRNALFLAAAGYAVDALDISAVALERAQAAAEARGLSINWLERDLELEPLPEARYALIVCVRYVNHTVLANIASRLAPGGCFLTEQHLHTDAEVVGPKDPRFRLRPGELAAALGTLEILECREGLVSDPDGGQAALVQLVARQREGETSNL